VQRGTIDIVELRWYVRPGGTGAPAATAWLEVARRHLPEALPRRFGSYEPLPMKLDVDGPDAFVQVAADETWSLGFEASAPCIEGSIATGSAGPGVHSHSLSVHREPLADRHWRAALQHLFADFATATDAVFGSAEVQRGAEWSGRSAWYGPTAERTTYLAARGQWAGLLPHPAWWSWFGPDYVPLVLDHLPADQVVHVDGSVFHARGEEPLDRDRLTAALRGPTAAPSKPPRSPGCLPSCCRSRTTATRTHSTRHSSRRRRSRSACAPNAEPRGTNQPRWAHWRPLPVSRGGPHGNRGQLHDVAQHLAGSRVTVRSTSTLTRATQASARGRTAASPDGAMIRTPSREASRRHVATSPRRLVATSARRHGDEPTR
jgi:hypothetical protein